MNAAFRRGEAITRLENYSDVIVLHLTLLVCFPDNQEVNHWKKEINAFVGIMKRYNKSKSPKGTNFDKKDIVRTLSDVISTNDGKDYIANDIMGQKKGMSIDSHEIDWTAVDEKIDDFALAVLGNS